MVSIDHKIQMFYILKLNAKEIKKQKYSALLFGILAYSNATIFKIRRNLNFRKTISQLKLRWKQNGFYLTIENK